MTPIQCVSDLATAFAQPRAFLFLWVNWSVYAQQSKSVADGAIATWHSEHPDEVAPCYSVDVSDQCGELWDTLAEWLTAEGRPAGNLLMSGGGPLIWIRFGHVVLHVLAPLQRGSAMLAAVSHSVFASHTGPSAIGDGDDDSNLGLPN